MKIEAVDDLPVRKSHGYRHHFEMTKELERIVETMKYGIWYKVLDCPYNNANDYYRVICNASKQLDYAILIKMRDGSIYIRRN